MPELKDPVSLDHISLELEQPFWTWPRWEGRGSREEVGGEEEKWEVGGKKKEESPEFPPPHGTLDACKAPLLSWATLSGFLFCEMKRSLTRTACFGPYAGLVAGAQRTVDESCQEAQVPAGAGNRSSCVHTLQSPHATVWTWHLFMPEMEAPWLSPKQLTQKQGMAPCLKGTRN